MLIIAVVALNSPLRRKLTKMSHFLQIRLLFFFIFEEFSAEAINYHPSVIGVDLLGRQIGWPALSYRRFLAESPLFMVHHKSITMSKSYWGYHNFGANIFLVICRKYSTFQKINCYIIEFQDFSDLFTAFIYLIMCVI